MPLSQTDVDRIVASGGGNFQGMDISFVNLAHRDLSKCNFHMANVAGVDFTGADVGDLSGPERFFRWAVADASGANFTAIRGASAPLLPGIFRSSGTLMDDRTTFVDRNGKCFDEVRAKADFKAKVDAVDPAEYLRETEQAIAAKAAAQRERARYIAKSPVQILNEEAAAADARSRAKMWRDLTRPPVVRRQVADGAIEKAAAEAAERDGDGGPAYIRDA
jgi:hypothetical protein